MIRILLSTRLGERRMTQSELARATGIRSQTINELYHDFAERVSLDDLDLICEALDCELDDLIVREPNPERRVKEVRHIPQTVNKSRNNLSCPDASSVRAFFVLIRHEFQKICGLAVQNGAQLVQNVQRNMLDGVVVHARQSGLANPSHCDQILLFDAFFGKHGFQLDANHVSTSLFFTISHLPENCNAFRKNIYEKCCFAIDIQRNSLYNIDIERRLRGAREQPKGGDAP